MVKDGFPMPGRTVLAAMAVGAAAAAGAMAQTGPITPAMVAKAMEDQHRTLLAQCAPPPPRLDPRAQRRFPMRVDRWGLRGDRVLLVHGGVQGRVGGGPATFDRQRALADKGWSLYRVTRPGFDGTPSWGPEDMTDDARALAALIVPGTNVIAHSWGGTEALLAAARRPRNVRSLVIIEPAIAPTIAGPAPLADPAVLADLKKRTITQLSAKTPGDFARVFALQMGEVAADDRLGPTLTPELATEAGCNGLYAKMASSDEILAAIASLKAANVPVLIVTGGWSPSIDATGDVLARLIGGKHVIVRSPNHFVQYANAPEFNRVVADFMTAAHPKKMRRE